MNLESMAKYFSPKSPTLSDSVPATASDSLTISDVMGAIGMCQSQAELGLAAFLGKIGISESDKVKAVLLLARYGLAQCGKVAAIRKLADEEKARVVLVLAVFAFMDYSRSAASEVPCDACDDGFIEAEVFTNKVHTPFPAKEIVKTSLRWGVKGFRPSEYEVHRELRERVKVLCSKCNGKRVIKTACNDCRGRRVVVDKDESERQGVPVKKACKRCSGRGYERLPSTKAFRVVNAIAESITLDTWKKSVKPFYDEMITRLDIEESFAESALRSTTK
ncbi:TPA: antitermination protein [Serratia rubidaea]|nr:antitermination protein [Serratia rubidaea]HDJ1447207.1 antitermination protein [Serratia rubidaea]HDJ1463266.1 antitermination protein [Serratia rubidaea]HDJ2773008.1 antitermination protein [Serratia rubidaea]